MSNTGTNKHEVIATGDTYAARSYLQELGFRWDAARKVWVIDADKFDAAEWQKYCSPSWDRKRARICNAVELVAQ